MSAVATRRFDEPGLAYGPNGPEYAMQWTITGATDDRNAMAATGMLVDVYHPDGTNYPNLRCRRVYIPRKEGPYPSAVIVQADFAIPPAGSWSQWGNTGDPLTAPPIVSWGSEKIWVPRDTTDMYYHPLTNSAGDPIDPPIMFPKTLPILYVKKWQVLYNPALAMMYVDHSNSDVVVLPGIGSCAKGTIWCRSILPASESNQMITVNIGTTTGTGWVIGSTVVAHGGATGTLYAFDSTTLTISAPTGPFDTGNVTQTIGLNVTHAAISTTVYPPRVLVVYEFAYDPDTHVYKIADRGSRGFYKISGGSTAAGLANVFPKGQVIGTGVPPSVVLLQKGRPMLTDKYQLVDSSVASGWAWFDNNQIYGTDITGDNRYTDPTGTSVPRMISFDRLKRRTFTGILD